MSEKLIPEHVDPYRFADQGLRLAGKVEIIDMHRLSSNLMGHSEPVSVNLEFGVDDQGLTFLKGHVDAQLSLQCQRCMEPLMYGIMSDFVLGVVNTLDEANALPEGYDPVVTKEGQLALRELIEDELILNLPIIPRHEPEDCKVLLPSLDSGKAQGKGENPFHVLESLKQNQKLKGGE